MSPMSQQMQNAQKLYMRGIQDGQIDEVHRHYMGASYTQHSTGVPDGKEGFKAFFQDFFQRNPERQIKIIRYIEDNNFVFLHVHQYLNQGQTQWVTADIFRADESGRIVEHWDVIEAYQAPVDGQVDPILGDFALDQAEDGAENKKQVRRFLTEVMQNQEFQSFNRYVSPDLIQHNLAMGQGGKAYSNYLQDHQVNYDFVFKLLAQGDYVVAYSKVWQDGQDYAWMDIFRLKDGLIVEHWDTKEAMPAKEDLTNLGKF